MLTIVIAGSVLGGWAMLSVLGGERQRRMQELDAAAAADKKSDVGKKAAAPGGKAKH